MSLNNSDKKNMPKRVFAQIQGFVDSKDFGITDSGELVHIADTSTWAGVFKNGLSVVAQYELRPPPESESVLPKKNHANLDARKSYDELFSISDNLIYKKPRVTRGPKTPRRYGDKQRKKTARAQQKTSFKKSASEKHEYIEKCDSKRIENMCGCCGKVCDTVQHINSVYSTKGSMMCFKCYQYEMCPGCGWESSGLCRYCRCEY